MSEDVNGIDRRRAAFRRRIEELDRKHCQSARELTETMREIVNISRQELRQGIAVALLECFENLVLRTPVDTGRLRAGWRIGSSGPVTLPAEGDYPNFKDDEAVRRTIQGAVSLDPGTRLTKADVLYVYNRVEYVLALNAGWSRRQAGGFIDKFLDELKTKLNELARQ